MRFPEFEGEWHPISLNTLCSLITKGTTPKEFSEGDVNFVKIESLNGINIIKENCKTVSTDIHENELRRSILEEDDILFAIAGATVGKVGVVTKEILPANTNQALAIIRLKEKPQKDFLLSVLGSRTMKKYIFQSMSVGAQPNLSLTQMNDFKFSIPTLTEQTKIASLLSIITNRIDTQIKIIEDYKLLKKGLMQGIFNQELRFKDEKGNYYPDWKHVKLGELYSFKTTNSFSRENLNYTLGEVKNIHYGDIHKNYHSHFYAGKERVPFINTSINIKKFPRDCYVLEGDLVIADASEDYADIGKTMEVINTNNQKILAGLHTFLARRKNTQLIIGFGGHLMQAHYVRVAIMRIAQGTKVLGVSTKRLAEIKLNIPTLPEQQKITSTLSALDKRIELETKYQKSLRAQKQYLLQNLFI